MKDKGMKWVIVADVMIAIVVCLLVWASYIEKQEANKQSQMYAQDIKEHNEAKTQQKEYDFDCYVHR